MQQIAVLVAGLIVGAMGGYYYGFNQGLGAVGYTEDVGESVSALLGDMEAIIGNWQSADDAKFTREFASDGALVDRYDGAAEDGDWHWMLFTKDIPDPAYTGPLEQGETYLAIGKTGEASLYFKVVKLEGDALDLVYMDRGGGLSFTRIR